MIEARVFTPGHQGAIEALELSRRIALELRGRLEKLHAKSPWSHMEPGTEPFWDLDHSRETRVLDLTVS